MNAKDKIKDLIIAITGETDEAIINAHSESFMDICNAYASSPPQTITDEEIEKEAQNQGYINNREINIFKKGFKWAINRTALPREGEETEVYSRDECVFEYCSAPEICREKEKCQHH